MGVHDKQIPCRVCGCSTFADEDAETIICGSCVMGSANHVAREQREKGFNECKFHPHYKGKSKPRSSCKTCHQIYKEVI